MRVPPSNHTPPRTPSWQMLFSEDSIIDPFSSTCPSPVLTSYKIHPKSTSSQRYPTMVCTLRMLSGGTTMSLSSNPSPSPSQRKSRILESSTDDSGILNERILLLLFESLKWDIHTLCHTSAVNRRLRALSRRLLWKELCIYRAPRMIATLRDGEPNGRIIGGWQALAKLLFFCGGCESSRHFQLSHPSPGHFVKSSRFSKTSGRSFLSKMCRGDVLYVSDPCEHPTAEKQDDVGIYRGVFRGFMKSKTRECLIRRQVEFEAAMRCPYCGARVWSMTAARLIPRKSAARRLGSSDDALEYFVCLNGHLHGTCWLVPLSSDEDRYGDGDEDGNSDEDDQDEGNANGRALNHHNNGIDGRIL